MANDGREEKYMKINDIRNYKYDGTAGRIQKVGDEVIAASIRMEPLRSIIQRTLLRLAAHQARVVLTGRKREGLEETAARIRAAGGEARVAPADVRENAVLQDLLRTKPTGSPNVARIWLGAPNSIKGPTEAVFERQTGNNLLIVGQRDEAILAILSVAVIALAAQFPAGGAKVLLLDGNPPGSTSRGTFDRLAQAHPQFVSFARPNEVADVMNSLIAELKTRAESDTPSNAPATFVILHDLQKIARLRYEDDFSFSSSEETAANPAAQLNRLITEGPALGLHVIATCDTYNNANRFLSKKAFSEFEMRVLFQMSANDSASLIDNPKAGALGLNRAIYYNEQEGYLELFRPYALPGEEWIEEAQRNLSRQPDV